ncbi:MAG TPA: ABC transporter permease [Gemmatimonadaceae bacterium]|nr:ABC transporter permease [Gemmatimonadaceae bacterium]
MSWFAAARARLHLLFAPRAAAARSQEEIDFHIAMETERLVREQRLSTEEARRRALATFGGVTQHREELRDGRGVAGLAGLSLDFRLGFRMLVKYPGLTIVGGLAMAFGIAVGTITFVMVSMFLNPTLPLPDGDRVVLLRNWDVSTRREEPRAIGDFIVWRRSLTAITDISAYRDVTRNIMTGTDDGRPVQVAEMTASGFRASSGQPLLGRVLSTADEARGAPPVVVIGYKLWQTRFAGDGSIVGKTVKVGDTYATIVGVMPKGYAFPVAHDLWMPLHWQAVDEAPRSGPGVTIFGRLAPGATLERAQSELTTLGKRAAIDLRATHEHLEPQVGSYAKQFKQPGADDLLAMASIETFPVLLLALICGNVALLLFARAATRESELAVRSALGASRGRIVAQLFAEALVLGGVAAVLGLVAAYITLDRWGLAFLEANLGRVPFWFDPKLSPATVLYAVGLTVVAAIIAGVMPALKITRGLHSSLKQNTAGAGGVRFSGVWTIVIVAQVAMTVAFPAIVAFERGQARHIQTFPAGFAAEEYVAMALAMDSATVSAADSTTLRAALEAQRTRFGAALEALRQRTAAEPGVFGVTFVDALPRTWHDHYRIEVEIGDPAPTGAAEATQKLLPVVSIGNVDPSYFSVLETPVLAGRAFDSRDLAPGARTAIVDQGFVDQVLRGRNAVGVRFRFKAKQGPPPLPGEGERPWFQIVGVVKELGMGSPTDKQRASGLYLPNAPQKLDRVWMMVHVKGDPLSIVPRIRTIAGAVEPTMRLSEIQRVSDVSDVLLWIIGLWMKVTVVLTALALLLSLAGIYAVLSFIVARRTREIGVRVALGASQRRIVVAIFRRPLIQVGIGVAIGGILIALASEALAHSEMSNAGNGLSLGLLVQLVAYGSLMFGVCLLACVVPTRRALSVEPTEALRVE